VPQRVHLYDRPDADRVAEVERVDAACQRRARRRLGGDEACAGCRPLSLSPMNG
jgi:hypothetical protein